MPLDHLYSEPTPPSLVRAKIANTPANAAARLWITIPTYTDPTAKWGPVTWSPHGNTMPQAGADCLVGFDDAGVPWLLSFVGGWS